MSWSHAGFNSQKCPWYLDTCNYRPFLRTCFFMHLKNPRQNHCPAHLKCSNFLGHPNAQHRALDQQCQHARPPPKFQHKRSTGIFSTKHPVDLAKMHLGAGICSALSVMRVYVYSMVIIIWYDVYVYAMYVYLRILVLTVAQNSSDLWWITIQEGVDVWISLLSITPFHRWGPHEVSGISRVKCALRAPKLEKTDVQKEIDVNIPIMVLALENNFPRNSRGFWTFN